MAILDMQLVQVGVVGFPVQQLLINTDNTIDEVLIDGYLTQYGNNFGIGFSDRQYASVYTTDGKVGVYQVSVDSNGIASLSADTDGAVNLPVLVDHIAMFDNLKGVIGCETSTSNSRAAINIGDIISGVIGGGRVGRFRASGPTASKGEFVFQGANNAANYTVAVINRSHAQASSHYVPDVGADSDFLLTTLANPDANENLIAFSASVGTTALASGAVTLFTSSGTKQYKIVSLSLNFGANLAVGDKDLTIAAGANTYSVIPSASLLTLANATWGSAAMPFPAAIALNTSTPAGASLTATYSGGTTNYTGGATIVISGLLQRVA